MDALTQQLAQANITITKANGQPGQVDGVPIWSSSDETVVIATAAPDGMSAEIETIAPGTARISVSADADLGSGTVTITGVSEDIVVTQNPNTQATSVAIGLGAFADKP